MINTNTISSQVAANATKPDSKGEIKSEVREKLLDTKGTLSQTLKQSLINSTTNLLQEQFSPTQTNQKLQELVDKLLNQIQTNKDHNTSIMKQANTLNFAPNFANELKLLSSELAKSDVFSKLLDKINEILKPASEIKSNNLAPLFKNSGVFFETKLKNALNEEMLPKSFYSLINSAKSLSSEKILSEIWMLETQNLSTKDSLKELQNIINNNQVENKQVLQASNYKILLDLSSKLENFRNYINKNPMGAEGKVNQIANFILKTLNIIKSDFFATLAKPENLNLMHNTNSLNQATQGFERLETTLKNILNNTQNSQTQSTQGTTQNPNLQNLQNTTNPQNTPNLNNQNTQPNLQGVQQNQVQQTTQNQPNIQNQNNAQVNSQNQQTQNQQTAQANSQEMQQNQANQNQQVNTQNQTPNSQGVQNQAQQTTQNQPNLQNQNNPTQNNAQAQSQQGAQNPPNSQGVQQNQANQNQQVNTQNQQNQAQQTTQNQPNLQNQNNSTQNNAQAQSQQGAQNPPNSQGVQQNQANQNTTQQTNNQNPNLQNNQNTQGVQTQQNQPNQQTTQNQPNIQNQNNQTQNNAQVNSQNQQAQNQQNTQQTTQIPINSAQAKQNQAAQVNQALHNALKGVDIVKTHVAKNLAFKTEAGELSKVENLSKDLANLSRRINESLKQLEPQSQAAKTNLSELRILNNKLNISLKDLSNIGVKTQQDIANEIKNDVKSTLLQISNLAKNEGDEAVYNASNRLLAQIENNQLLSLANDTINTYLPFFWEDLNDSKVVFRRGKKDKFFAQIKLEFAHLGELEVLVCLNNEKYIDINIMAENVEFRKTIYEHAHELKRSINKAGLLSSNFFIGDIIRSKFDTKNLRNYDLQMGMDKKV
ncbi:flagellar hook-length control protein FliK [Campylobacter sp. LR185c]|uniref:flagellar hook-length control protein FliK n=2 Tax=Campylobacter sp. LR185c TaxID=2014525 RepID=UPI00123A33C3|nr:flagellar hook-length control protein FliK [Campylobacter sp. LR185c]KAA8604974.1 flagellar hook-length control protein FliK [Campylobacter sp. LR185c]